MGVEDRHRSEQRSVAEQLNARKTHWNPIISSDHEVLEECMFDVVAW